MEFHSCLNLLLEALAYLGRRAGGFTTGRMLERLRERGVEDTARIETLLEPITRLSEKLDRAVKLDNERLDYLFGNLPGDITQTATGTCFFIDLNLLRQLRNRSVKGCHVVCLTDKSV